MGGEALDTIPLPTPTLPHKGGLITAAAGVDRSPFMCKTYKPKVAASCIAASGDLRMGVESILAGIVKNPRLRPPVALKILEKASRPDWPLAEISSAHKS